MSEYLNNLDKYTNEYNNLDENLYYDIDFSWPDMTKIQKVNFGKESGIIILNNKEE